MHYSLFQGTSILNSLRLRFPNVAQNIRTKADRFQHSSFMMNVHKSMSRIPNSFRADPLRLTVAAGESMLIRRVFSPVSIPLKIVTTLLIIEKFKASKPENNRDL